MPREDEARLLDMLIAPRRVEQFTRGMSREQFLEDERTKYAVIYCLLIIGEVASAVSDDTRVELSDVSWAAMRGMRNRIVHEYIAMEWDVVWDVVANEVRPLCESLERHVPPPDAE